MGHWRGHSSFLVCWASGDTGLLDALKSSRSLADPPGDADDLVTITSDPGRLVVGRGRPAQRWKDGWLVFDGVALGNGGTAPRGGGPVLPVSTKHAHAAAVTIERLRGNFTLAVALGSGDVLVGSDVLGGAPLFVYANGGTRFVANDAWLLENVLAGVGVPLRRDPWLFGLEAVFGSPAFETTGFEDVQLAAMGELFVVSPEGRVSSMEMMPRPGWYTPPGGDYGSLIAEAEAEMRANVGDLVAAGYRERVSDLTGGVDSRLVLAALMSEGVEEEFHFSCGGSFPGPDYTTFDYLRNVLELSEGRLRSRQSEISFQEDPVAAATYVMRRTMSCYSHVFDPGAPQADARDLLHLKGGFAGTFKAVHATDYEPGEGVGPVEHLFRQRRWHVQAPRLTAQARHRVEESVEQWFRSRLAHGVRAEDALDQWYIEHRNRYHFGVSWTARLPAQTTFHPLYSPSAVRAAYVAGPSARTRRAVSFDLMARMAPPLVLLPFANYRWDRSLLDSPHDRTLHEISRPIGGRARFPEQWHTGPSAGPMHGSSTPLRTTPHKQMSAWARQRAARGRPQWEVIFDQVLPVARDVALSLPRDHEVWDVFDRSASERLLTRDIDRSWRYGDVLFAYKVFTAAVWTSSDNNSLRRVR